MEFLSRGPDSFYLCMRTFFYICLPLKLDAHPQNMHFSVEIVLETVFLFLVNVAVIPLLSTANEMSA